MGILKIFKKKKNAWKCSVPTNTIQTKTEKYKAASAGSIQIEIERYIVSPVTPASRPDDEGSIQIETEGYITQENIGIAYPATPASTPEDEGTAVNVNISCQGPEISSSGTTKVIGSLNLDNFLIDLLKGGNAGGDQNDAILSSQTFNSSCSSSSNDDSDIIHDEDNVTSHDDDIDKNKDRRRESEDDTIINTNGLKIDNSGSGSGSSFQALYHRYIPFKPLDKRNRSNYRNSLIDDVSSVGSDSGSCESVRQNSLIRDVSRACTNKDTIKGFPYFNATNTLGPKVYAIAGKSNIERSTTEETVKIRNTSFADALLFKDESNPSKGGRIRSLLDNVCTTR